MEFTVGCTTRPYSELPFSFSETFERIAEAGFTDVAVFGNQGGCSIDSESSSKEVALVRKAALDAGVIPSMLLGATKLNLGQATALEEYKRLIDHTAALGAAWLLDCGTSRQEHYNAYFDLMSVAAPYAQQVGVQITMKPHGGISLTIGDLIAACKRVNHPAFGICFDPGNIIYYTAGEMRPEKGIAELAPKVSTCIVKDCELIDKKPNVMVTVGDGLVDFYKVFSGLVKVGFPGPFYVECVGSTDARGVDRDVAYTIGYVKGILKTL